MSRAPWVLRSLPRSQLQKVKRFRGCHRPTRARVRAGDAASHSSTGSCCFGDGHARAEGGLRPFRPITRVYPGASRDLRLLGSGRKHQNRRVAVGHADMKEHGGDQVPRAASNCPPSKGGRRPVCLCLGSARDLRVSFVAIAGVVGEIHVQSHSYEFHRIPEGLAGMAVAVVFRIVGLSRLNRKANGRSIQLEQQRVEGPPSGFPAKENPIMLETL